MSKYSRLIEYLQDHKSETVTLSFAEIEQIIGSKLPKSAKTHQAWWANSRTDDSHVWAHEWIDAGWEKHHLNLPDSEVSFKRQTIFEAETKSAIEGYLADRKILARGRNRALAEKCKKENNYTCEACGFYLKIGARHVIEAHHVEPLSVSGRTETSLKDLAVLCPTCHRIAHMRSVPYTVAEIVEIHKANQ